MHTNFTNTNPGHPSFAIPLPFTSDRLLAKKNEVDARRRAVVTGCHHALQNGLLKQRLQHLETLRRTSMSPSNPHAITDAQRYQRQDFIRRFRRNHPLARNWCDQQILSVVWKKHRTQTNSHAAIFSLPPELLNRVFGFLVNSPASIANSRLVCTDFKKHSTPFWIPRVVFAHQLRPIHRLHRILDQPYLRRHVTELVYDASLYDGSLANCWSSYVAACEDGTRALVDPEWSLANRSEWQVWQDLSRYTEPETPVSVATSGGINERSGYHDHSQMPLSSPHHDQSSGRGDLSMDANRRPHLSQLNYSQTNVGADTNKISSDGNKDTRGSDVHSTSGSSVDDDAYSPHSSDASTESTQDTEFSLEEDPDVYHARVLRQGCHRGFARYHRLYKAQAQITAAKLEPKMLSELVSRFPRLRHIVFTDFRHFAQKGDDYNRLCARQFGRYTLQPDHLGDSMAAWGSLISLLNVLADSAESRVDSFSIGDGPFLYSPGTCEVDDFDPRYPSYVPLSLFLPLDKPAIAKVARAFAKLKRLELPFEMPPEALQQKDQLRHALAPLEAFLRAAAPNLSHLKLGVADLIESHTSDGPDGEVTYHPVATGAEWVFPTLLSPLLFPKLRSLDLRGWVLEPKTLCDFLAGVSETVREVRLINCLITGGSAGQREVAVWAGRHLTGLVGVEIVGYLSCFEGNRGGEGEGKMHRMSLEETEALWMGGRTNMIQREAGGSGGKMLGPEGGL